MMKKLWNIAFSIPDSSGNKEGPDPPPPHLFWVKKEEMIEGKKASRASKSNKSSKCT